MASTGTTGTTTTVTTRVPEGLAAALEAIALVENRSMGSLMREILEDWLVRNFDASAMAGRLEDLRKQQEELRDRFESLVNQALEERATAADEQSSVSSDKAATGSLRTKSSTVGKASTARTSEKN